MASQTQGPSQPHSGASRTTGGFINRDRISATTRKAVRHPSFQRGRIELCEYLFSTNVSCYVSKSLEKKSADADTIRPRFPAISLEGSAVHGETVLAEAEVFIQRPCFPPSSAHSIIGASRFSSTREPVARELYRAQQGSLHPQDPCFFVISWQAYPTTSFSSRSGRLVPHFRRESAVLPVLR